MEHKPGKAEGQSLSASAIEKPGEEEVADFLKLDKAIFPTMPVQESELRGTLESDGVQVMLRDAKGNAAGYMISLPHDEALEFLKKLDASIQPEEKALYVESIGILPEHRSLKNFRSLWETFKHSAEEKGYRKVTAHVRVSEGLSDVFERRLGAKKLRRLENWADFGEPFDYIELDLGPKS